MKKNFFAGLNFTRTDFFGFIISTSIIAMLIFGFSLNSFAESDMKKSKKTIAILPFEMISSSDISYIQSGTLQMLHSRLFWKNHVNVIEKRIINSHLGDLKTLDQNIVIQKIADLTKSDYVLSGSITQFSNAFSIDARIYDIKNQRFLTFFEQSKLINDVIPKLNVITAKINKKVFDRETIAYAHLAKEEKDKAEQWKRQSPERLMPSIPAGEPGEKKSIWRFWEYL